MIYSDCCRLAMTLPDTGTGQTKVGKMDINEEDAKKRVEEYSINEDLDALSIEELHKRIAAYEVEINRLRLAIDEKHQVKNVADAVFRR